MKKFIIILLSILCLSSCYKTYVDRPQLSPGFYSDEVVVCDTLIYNMSCQVYSDSAKMQLMKRVWITLDSHTVHIADKDLEVKDNKLLVLQEDIKYSALGFKKMLKEKNEQPRDSWWFMFTPNIGITWYTFDKMFNKYIKEE